MQLYWFVGAHNCVLVTDCLLHLMLSFLLVEAALVGVRKRMTIVLIAVSNSSTWRSRLLCEYHLWPIV